jgi:hypothetical protein
MGVPQHSAGAHLETELGGGAGALLVGHYACKAEAGFFAEKEGHLRLL